MVSAVCCQEINLFGDVIQNEFGREFPEAKKILDFYTKRRPIFKRFYLDISQFHNPANSELLPYYITKFLNFLEAVRYIKELYRQERKNSQKDLEYIRRIGTQKTTFLMNQLSLARIIEWKFLTTCQSKSFGKHHKKACEEGKLFRR